MESTRSKILVGVVVAVVGTVASTIMGWIPNPFEVGGNGSAASGSARVRLFIEGVEAFGRSVGEVRVTAFVNGTEFVYPSLGGVEWVEVGPSMSSQSFALPPTDSVEIRFEMETRDGRRFLSQQTAIVDIASGLPHSSDYPLHQVDGRSRAAPVAAAVRYSIQSAP